jgi:hypothetical protein
MVGSNGTERHREGYPWTTVTPRSYRIAGFVFSAFWTGLGVWSLATGDYILGCLQVALGVGWLLRAFFRPRYSSRFEAAIERQRSRVEGFGAMSFLPDTDSDSQNQ